MNAVALTESENLQLTDLEGIIERGMKTFVAVGAAIRLIRDKRLYRTTHSTFEDYCQDRWDWDRRHVNRQIEAAEVVGSLGSTDPKPTNVRQTRELAKVPKEDRAKVWDEAVKTAPVKNGKPAVTAKHIEAVATESGNREKSDGIDMVEPQTKRQHQLAGAQKKRLLTVMVGIEGCRMGLAALKLDMAFSVMDDDERREWVRSIRDSARQFSALVRELDPSVGMGERPAPEWPADDRWCWKLKSIYDRAPKRQQNRFRKWVSS